MVKDQGHLRPSRDYVAWRTGSSSIILGLLGSSSFSSFTNDVHNFVLWTWQAVSADHGCPSLTISVHWHDNFLHALLLTHTLMCSCWGTLSWITVVIDRKCTHRKQLQHICLFMVLREIYMTSSLTSVATLWLLAAMCSTWPAVCLLEVLLPNCEHDILKMIEQIRFWC